MRLVSWLSLMALGCGGPPVEDGKPLPIDVDGDGVIAGEDCNDSNAQVKPGAPELCDGIDNNCDENVDGADATDLRTWYADADGDYYGTDAGPVQACVAPVGYVAVGGDCNDDSPRYRPGAPEADCTDPNDYNCDGSVAYADADADGFPACEDCNDASAAIHDGAAERCDGIDQDCDGTIDEGAVDAATWYLDADGDSFGLATASVEDCDQPAGYVATGDDCNDTDPAFHPGATETCADPQDYNCDGSSGGADADNDGFKACEECNDSNAAINPDATERCDSADVDENCNGLADDADSGVTGKSSWYEDHDGDTYGDPSSSRAACSQPTGYVADNTDCNDLDTAYNPAAPETDCTDPNDYNCDGSSARDDADNDGFAACEDCDDSDADVNTDAIEYCNGADDNCDGTIDEASADDAPTWYLDADADGYGAAKLDMVACDQPTGYVANALDCNDGAGAIYPNASESCDGVDNNCDGQVDEPTAAGVQFWYTDDDGDGYGDPNASTQACDQPVGYVADDTDCDDDREDSNPGATEYCNSEDDDCDGTVDEDAAVDARDWYRDSDNDGYGNASVRLHQCYQPTGYLSDYTDCDDTDAGRAPNLTEVCDTANKDEDCDATADDNDTSTLSSTKFNWYQDNDRDNYGNAAVSLSRCDQPSGYVSASTDCDDTDSGDYPGATEITGNSDDENCDGTEICYDDDDNDGYLDTTGDTRTSTNTVCTDANEGLVADPTTDCDDSDSGDYPGAAETVANSDDEDCDGVDSCYTDADNDNHGTTVVVDGSTLNCTTGTGAPVSTDCDDTDSGDYPNATETVANGDDEDCDGVDSCYTDADGDNYGTTVVVDGSSLNCTTGTGAPVSTDCDDTDSSDYPGAAETVANSDDEDCDGVDSCYTDADNDNYGTTVVVDGSTLNCTTGTGAPVSTDCDDSSNSDYPGAAETVANGDDEDCDGVDSCYTDADNDNYGTTVVVDGSSLDCATGTGAPVSTDCDDSSNSDYPGAAETVNNGDDEDCDGVDSCYTDADGDNYGTSVVVDGSTLNCTTGTGAPVSTDCDDSDSGDYPGAAETVANGDDEDCDGVDSCYTDADGDNYGTTVVVDGSTLNCTTGTGAPVSTDCNDNSAAINPGATEICDAANTDENCSGTADDNDSSVSSATRSTWYRDSDADTYGALASTLSRCDQPTGYVSNSTDCNDSAVAINPAASEVCDSSNVDENCNGYADDLDTLTVPTNRTAWYRDADSDTYGLSSNTLTRCDQPTGYVSTSTDCNDSVAAVNPGASEVCDASDVDENCNGYADDLDTLTVPSNRSTWYRDADSDTYGTTTTTDTKCNQPTGYVSNSTDCNDGAAAINPGASEVCDASNVDENCNGLADDLDTQTVPANPTTWYLDADGDTYGTSATSQTKCDQPAGYVTTSTDCNDSSNTVYPGAAEIAQDNLDNDCDGVDDARRTGTRTLTTDAGITYTGASLDTGSLGGNMAGGYDINGDGYPDVVISDRGYDVGTGSGNSEYGMSYLQTGGAGGLSSSLSTTTFQLWNSQDHYSGQGTGMVADLDADNDDELLIGAYQYDATGANSAGSVALFRGSTTISGAQTEANANILISGTSANQYVGWAMAGLGDVYGSDTKPDWAFSAIGTNFSAVYVVSGALANGTTYDTSAAITSISQASNGQSVGSALVGDYDNDGDGSADLAFAAAGTSAVYVYQGPLASGALPLTNADVTLSITTMAAWVSTQYYSNVANVGDTNGDGYDDLVVGGDNASSGSGKAYLYLGPVGSATAASVTLTGSANDGLGRSVSGSIDVDRDGRDDWLVGAQGADSSGTNNGAVALIYGGASGSYTLSTLAASTSGAVWYGSNGALLGTRVLGAGDLDADNYDDFLFSGVGVKNGSNKTVGATYVLYGTGE